MKKRFDLQFKTEEETESIIITGVDNLLKAVQDALGICEEVDKDFIDWANTCSMDEDWDEDDFCVHRYFDLNEIGDQESFYEIFDGSGCRFETKDDAIDYAKDLGKDVEIWHITQTFVWQTPTEYETCREAAMNYIGQHLDFVKCLAEKSGNKVEVADYIEWVLVKNMDLSDDIYTAILDSIDAYGIFN